MVNHVIGSLPNRLRDVLVYRLDLSKVSTFFAAFLQGIGWTAGWLLTMFAVFAFNEIRDWIIDKILRGNGLK